MDLSKSYEFFQPEKDKSRIHIVGCGSVGSTIAENLARCGVTRMTLWDFDDVEPHNIVNQMFTTKHIGMKKVDALADILTSINPEIVEGGLKLEPKGWNGRNLSGYVFLAVDNIELRRKIVEQHIDNGTIKAMFDVRTMLTGAQHYAADWNNVRMKQNLLNSMDFSHDEASEEVEVSACGVVLGVVTTVRLISAIAVNNFIKFSKGIEIWKFVQMDGFTGSLDCF